MAYADSYYTLVNPTPTTVRSSTGGISLADKFDILEQDVLNIESELGLVPKSIDDTVVVDANPTTVGDFLDMVARRIKDISGEASWTTALDDDIAGIVARFDITTGHGHDGSDSKTLSHTDLTGVTSDQHHAQAHADSDHSGANKVEIEKAGVDVGTRAILNFIEGSNVTLTMADDAVDGEIDITVAASGSLATFETREDGIQVVAETGTLDFQHGFDVTDAGGGVAEIDVDESELDFELLANASHGLFSAFHVDNFEVSAGAGLVLNYDAGRITVNETTTAPASGTLTLTDESTNYVFVGTDGVVAFNTAGFPVNSIPIAEVTTTGAAILSIFDKRALRNTRTDELKIDGSVALTADWDAGAFKITAQELSTDTISEETAAAGVTVDGLLIKDGAIPGLASSTWTPTLFNTTNIDASTAIESNYIRIGNIVICWGQVNIDPTAAGGAVTLMGMSLPIASNFVSAQDAGGSCNGMANAQLGGTVDADSANDRVRIRFLSQITANSTFVFHFTYKIL